MGSQGLLILAVAAAYFVGASYPLFFKDLNDLYTVRDRSRSPLKQPQPDVSQRVNLYSPDYFVNSCNATSCSFNINVPIPGSNTTAIQNMLNNLTTNVGNLNATVSGLQTNFTTQQTATLNQLGNLGTQISTIMTSINQVNANYSNVMAQVYSAQNTLNGLQAIVTCYKGLQCSTQTTTTSTAATTTAHPCNPNPCLHGGTCTASGSTHTCQCTNGWTGNNCQTDTLCPPGKCLNGGTCTRGTNSFSCHCVPWYTGTTCNTGLCSGIAPPLATNSSQTYRFPPNGTFIGNCTWIITIPNRGVTGYQLQGQVLGSNTTCSASPTIQLTDGHNGTVLFNGCPAQNSPASYGPSSQNEVKVTITSTVPTSLSLNYIASTANPCATNPITCQNNGTCANNLYTATCNCQHASNCATGPTCNLVPTNPCLVPPGSTCRANGGTCTPTPTCPPDFTCTCPQGKTPPLCH